MAATCCSARPGLPATQPTGEQTALPRQSNPERAVQYHDNCGPDILVVEPQVPARHATDRVGGVDFGANAPAALPWTARRCSS